MVVVSTAGIQGSGFVVKSPRTQRCIVLSSAHVVGEGRPGELANVTLYSNQPEEFTKQCYIVTSGWQTGQHRIEDDFVALECPAALLNRVVSPFVLPAEDESVHTQKPQV